MAVKHGSCEVDGGQPCVEESNIDYLIPAEKEWSTLRGSLCMYLKNWNRPTNKK